MASTVTGLLLGSTVTWLLLGSTVTGLLLGSTDAAPGPEGTTASPGVTLLDGKTVDGRLEEITAEGLRIAGHKSPIPAYEVQEIRFAAREASAKDEVDFSKHPLVRFRGGEQLAARLLEVTPTKSAASDGAGPATGKLVALLRIEGSALPEIRVPFDAST